MFGIFSRLTQKYREVEHRARFPHLVSRADGLFTSFGCPGTPNPAFQRLFRIQDKNPESVDRDSAHLLYYLTKSLKAQVVIEVGIYRGAGSLHLAQALAENRGQALHLVDISAAYLEDVQRKIRRQKYPLTVSPHCGRSDDAKILAALPSADLIFLDADHSYAAAKQDFDHYWPKVKPHGLLVIHDTVMWPGTRTLANELFHRRLPITTLATSGGAGISFIRKIHG